MYIAVLVVCAYNIYPKYGADGIETATKRTYNNIAVLRDAPPPLDRALINRKSTLYLLVHNIL